MSYVQDLDSTTVRSCLGGRELVRARPTWDEYFSELAQMVARRSTCLRRNVGSLLVKGDRIISSGYNGAPQGIRHCLDIGCLREDMGIPSGERYELCRGVHAEQNAIINAARYGVSTIDSVIYSTRQPCMLCARMIINAGVKKVVHQGDFTDDISLQFFKEANVEVVEIKIKVAEINGDQDHKPSQTEPADAYPGIDRIEIDGRSR